MVAQEHGKFGPIVVADPSESFRIKKNIHAWLKLSYVTEAPWPVEPQTLANTATFGELLRLFVSLHFLVLNSSHAAPGVSKFSEAGPSSLDSSYLASLAASSLLSLEKCSIASLYYAASNTKLILDLRITNHGALR